ncbi:MAG: DUF3426 domain-containing protein [Candidatus Binataceae bacterium]
MIEIQCTSCNTRYRIDERILPEDAPTFKCSRCGHVFSSEGPPRPRKPTVAEPEPAPAPTPPAPAPSAALHHAAPPEPQPGAIHTVPPPPMYHNFPPEHEDVFAAKPSVPFAEPAPAAAEENDDVDDPLNRSFDETPPKADTGDRLRFDFNTEANNPAHDRAAAALAAQFAAREHRDTGWEAGDLPPDLAAAPARNGPASLGEPEAPAAIKPAPPIQHSFGPTMFAPAAQQRSGNGTPPHPPARPHFDTPPPRPMAAPAHAPAAKVRAPIAEEIIEAAPGKPHSAGYFLGMFLIIAAGFLGASAVICNDPAASARTLANAPAIGQYFTPPIGPATLVALHGVNPAYRTIAGGRTALVITGEAENVGGRPLHIVQLGAELLDGAGRTIAHRNVFCGNDMAARMVAEMTPHEIGFSQELSPRPGFAIKPAAAAPFLMVFANPPAAARTVRIAVLKADAAQSPPPAVSSAAPHAG